jgi:hypothetical protein
MTRSASKRPAEDSGRSSLESRVSDELLQAAPGSTTEPLKGGETPVSKTGKGKHVKQLSTHSQALAERRKMMRDTSSVTASPTPDSTPPTIPPSSVSGDVEVSVQNKE